MFCGTATAVVELRNASSSTREPGSAATRPPTDSRDSAMASSLPAFIIATASSGFLTFTVVALGDAATEARPVAALPGSRVLDEAFLNSTTAVAVPQNKPAARAYVTEFIEEAKASGLIRRALDMMGLKTSQVAPAGMKA